MIPTYDEGAVIADVVRDIKTIFAHVVCVDDGSSDDSAYQAESAWAIVIRHAVNISQGGALATWFLFVTSVSNVRYVITFDADGKHDPQEALAMLQHL